MCKDTIYNAQYQSGTALNVASGQSAGPQYIVTLQNLWYQWCLLGKKMASEATVSGTMHLRAGAAVGSLSSTSSQQHYLGQLPAAGIMVTNPSLVETQTEEVN